MEIRKQIKKIGLFSLYFLIILFNISGVLAQNYFNYTQDIEDSYYCDSNITDCVYAVDENWETYAYVGNEVGLEGAYIYENFTIQQNETEELINLYLVYSLMYGSPIIYCWNYSSLTFEEISDLKGINVTIVIPNNCYSNSIFRIKSKLNYDTNNSRYYETKIILEMKSLLVNNEIPFEIDFNSISHVMFLFVLVFTYLGVMMLGFMFKNGGFISFGFFIGIILGFMLSGFHIFLTLLFIFMNISIIWAFIKK